MFRRGIVARDPAATQPAAALRGALDASPGRRPRAAGSAGASHALAVLVEPDEGADRVEFGGTINLAIAVRSASRRAPRASSAGATGSASARSRLGLDCLRRYLLGLPVVERIDFERSEQK